MNSKENNSPQFMQNGLKGFSESITSKKSPMQNSIVSSNFLHAFVTSPNEIHIGSNDHFDKGVILSIPNDQPNLTDLSFHPYYDSVLATSSKNMLQLYKLPLTPEDEPESSVIINYNPANSFTKICFDEQLDISQFLFPSNSQFIVCRSIENQSCSLYDMIKPLVAVQSWKNDFIPNHFDVNYFTGEIAIHEKSTRDSESFIKIYDTRQDKSKYSSLSRMIKCCNQSDSRIMFLDEGSPGNLVLISYVDTEGVNTILIWDRRNLKTSIAHISSDKKDQTIYLPSVDHAVNRLLFSRKNHNYMVHFTFPDMDQTFSQSEKEFIKFNDDILDHTLLRKYCDTTPNFPSDMIICLTLTKSGIFPTKIPSISASQATSHEIGRYLGEQDVFPVPLEKKMIIQNGILKPYSDPSDGKSEVIQFDINRFKYLQGEIIEKKRIRLPELLHSDFFKINLKFAFFVTACQHNLAFLMIDSEVFMSQKYVGKIHCSSLILSFALDPFDQHRLAIGCSDGYIRIYKLSEDIGQRILNADAENMLVLTQMDSLLGFPTRILQHRTNYDPFKLIIQFHTMAQDVIASCVYDTVCIWDLGKRTIRKEFQLNFAIYSIEWNRFRNGGIYLAALGQENLQIINVAKTYSSYEHDELDIPGSTRVGWALNDKIVLVTTFDRSNRKVLFYRFAPENQNTLSFLSFYEYEQSFSQLTPYFDEDSHILFLSSRGESINILSLDLIQNEEETLIVKPLADQCLLPKVFRAVDFWPKQKCDVRKCEIVVGFGLMDSSIGKFHFIVPRNFPEYFHDEIYPPSFICDKPLFMGPQWFDKLNKSYQLSAKHFRRIDLKPEDMIAYSSVKDDIQKEKQELRRQRHLQLNQGNQDQELLINQDQLIESMSNLTFYDPSSVELPQDKIEGVDPNEWDV